MMSTQSNKSFPLVSETKILKKNLWGRTMLSSRRPQRKARYVNPRDGLEWDHPQHSSGLLYHKNEWWWRHRTASLKYIVMDRSGESKEFGPIGRRIIAKEYIDWFEWKSSLNLFVNYHYWKIQWESEYRDFVYCRLLPLRFSLIAAKPRPHDFWRLFSRIWNRYYALASKQSWSKSDWEWLGRLLYRPNDLENMQELLLKMEGVRPCRTKKHFCIWIVADKIWWKWLLLNFIQ